jgi:L,D-transpeptidase ErfK/SrfK
MKKLLLKVVVTLATICTSPAHAETYAIPANQNHLIGTIDHITTFGGETLSSLAQHFDLGLNAMVNSNPDISSFSYLPAGMNITIPSTHLLPPLPRAGIVINLPEMRLYYYPAQGDGIVMTYPIGIGRVGKTIPIKKTLVTRKTINPTWTPPEDIRAFNKAQGVQLPFKILPGPDNPLGPYAIYLQIPTYLIHSTIFPDSIGRRASFGCIRMLQDDIKAFFPLVVGRTPVIIVDMPNKVAWEDKHLYLESHPPLEEHMDAPYATYNGIIDLITASIANTTSIIDWQMVEDLAESRDGLPHDIGYKLH